MSLRSFYEIGYEEVGKDSPHFIAIKPDMRIPTIADLEADSIAELGVEHVLCDVDATITPNGLYDLWDLEGMTRLSQIAQDARFRSFSLATDSHANITPLATRIGSGVKLYQPIEENDGRLYRYKSDLLFWKRILSDLGVRRGKSVAMIGDSPRYDILPAKRLGFRTIQVDRMVAHLRRPSEIESI